MAWGILQIVVFLVLLGLIAKPLGTYMAHVYRGERTVLHPVLRPVERFAYRLCGVDETREMGVVGYAVSMIVFNFVVLLVIPVAFTYLFGRFAGNQRQGWALFAAAMVLLVMSVSVMYASEQRGNPNFTKLGVSQAATATQSGGNQEGKEVRNGIGASVLWATITTDTSTGAVNNAHDSLTPLAGGMAMLNIALGEVVFGGVGVGIMGLLIFAVLSVFIAGLMVGRTPEYLGKKIEGRDMKLAVLATLYFCVTALGLAAIAAVVPAGKDAVLNHGPHGLSEMLYAAISQTGNNGSAFAGLTVSGKFWSTAGGLIMLWGRFFFIIPCLALASSLGAKKSVPESSGTFPTTGPLFVVLVVGVILVVGALTYFPVLALGPIVEQFLMNAGHLFS